MDFDGGRRCFPVACGSICTCVALALVVGCGSPEADAKKGVAAELAAVDQAVAASRGTGDASQRSAIRERLSHDDPTVRAHAVQSIGRVRDWDSMPTLITLLRDSDPVVQARAVHAVGCLLGQHFELAPNPSSEELDAYVVNVEACYRGMLESPPPQYR